MLAPFLYGGKGKPQVHIYQSLSIRCPVWFSRERVRKLGGVIWRLIWVCLKIRPPKIHLQVVYQGKPGAEVSKLKGLQPIERNKDCVYSLLPGLLWLAATSSWLVNLMPCLLNVGSFPISSDLIASQFLSEIAHCIPLSPQSVSSHLISTQLIASHVFSDFLPHLIPSHVFSPFLSSSQLITTVLFSSHVPWAFLISSHLISAYLSFSQIFTALLNSSQLSAAHVSSSCVFSSLPWTFSHLPSSSHISSADLSSCQLVSPHLSSSQRTLKSSQLFSGPQPAPKTNLGAKASDPCAFYREDFAQRSLCTAFTHSKLLHTASLYTQQTFTERSFYTQIAWRSCVCQGIRGGCMKDLPGCSWELLAKGVVGRSCKVFNNSLWEDLCRDPGAVLEEVLAWSSTGPCEQILRRSCWKPPQAALGLCIGACMKVFLGCS